MAAAEIHHWHSENEVFNADLFNEDCKNKFQTQSFSGVGAHHHNDLAEQSIQTIMYMTQTFMVNVFLHWSEYSVDNCELWGFAVKHTVWLLNHIPNHLSGLKPLQLLTKTKANHCDLLHTHVWGCSMSLIQSCKMVKKFLIGIVGHVWANFWILAIHILLLWP